MTGQELEHKVNVSEARAQIRLIEAAWGKLSYAFQKIQWGRYGENYLKEQIAEERAHDRGRSEGCRRFLTITQAAKLFAVKSLVEYVYNGGKLDAKDYISIKHSHYMAYSLAKNYTDEIKEALQGFDIQKINNVDYADIEALAQDDDTNRY